MRLYTIGHSTRSLADLIAALKAHGVARVVDVRIAPASRRFPHFNADYLAAQMPAAGLDYAHLPALGGRRQPEPKSRNLGWRNEGFRGFADYMATGEFADGLRRLLALGREKPSAVMCAEADHRRCHRMLLADAVTVRRIEVAHILDANRLLPHELTPFARYQGGRLLYPVPE